MSPRLTTRFWPAWILANAGGEFAGLGLLALVGIVVAPLLTGGSVIEALAMAAILILLGGYEGVVVGYAQWLVLRNVFGTMQARSWVTATAVGSIVAWTAGMVPSTVAAFAEPAAGSARQLELELPMALIVTLTAFGGAFVGALLGSAQMFVLRRFVAHAGWWIPANAAAWAVSMPIVVAAGGLAGAATPRPIVVGEMLAAITLSGAVAGAVHGSALVALIRHSREESSPLPVPMRSRT
jgi:hypothetical protein